MTSILETAPETIPVPTKADLFRAIEAAHFALLTVGCEATEQYLADKRSGKPAVPLENNERYLFAEAEHEGLQAILMYME
ncbi:MAG TPA: hypothetical protein VHD60_04205 [Candidatus Saccharimonadales bacterium]|nr:hypothetical protein [Candidatus Saccharimonadales bacterium]